ncbi:MAG: 30S ribosomal protein S4 [Candidatus Aenigmarchaeota archaeon]|nr:30S ribosomal protein S4 [Candidatus Aenigmarchaeota archaeon]
MRVLKKKYKHPKRPWDSSRIEEEKKVLKEFGLNRKKEIWRAEEIVRNFRRRARNLIAVQDDEKKKALVKKVSELGLLRKDQELKDILSLTSKDILGRRLQTIIYRKELADSIRHARQKITHGHVYIDGRRVIFPSLIVPVEKEGSIIVKGADKK